MWKVLFVWRKTLCWHVYHEEKFQALSLLQPQMRTSLWDCDFDGARKPCLRFSTVDTCRGPWQRVLPFYSQYQTDKPNSDLSYMFKGLLSQLSKIQPNPPAPLYFKPTSLGMIDLFNNLFKGQYLLFVTYYLDAFYWHLASTLRLVKNHYFPLCSWVFVKYPEQLWGDLFPH